MTYYCMFDSPTDVVSAHLSMQMVDNHMIYTLLAGSRFSFYESKSMYKVIPAKKLRRKLIKKGGLIKKQEKVWVDKYCKLITYYELDTSFNFEFGQLDILTSAIVGRNTKAVICNNILRQDNKTIYWTPLLSISLPVEVEHWCKLQERVININQMTLQSDLYSILQSLFDRSALPQYIEVHKPSYKGKTKQPQLIPLISPYLLARELLHQQKIAKNRGSQYKYKLIFHYSTVDNLKTIFSCCMC